MAEEKNEFSVFKNVIQNSMTPSIDSSEEVPNIEETQEEITEEVETIEEKPEEIRETVEDTPAEDTSNIKVIAAHFAEKGLLTGFDPESLNDMDEEEAFETAINATVDTRLKEYKDSIPEEARYLLEYLEQGGDPRQYAEMMARPDYSKLDLKDNESTQKKVIRDYLSVATRLTPEQIERKIERFIEKDTLESEATEALEELKYAQEQEREYILKSQKEQAEAQAKAYEKYKEDLKKNIETRKEISGFGISDTQKKQLYEHITKPVTKDGKTQLMVNSEKDPDITLKYAFLDMLGWDINKLSKFMETKITKSLKEKLKSGDTMTRVKGRGDEVTETEPFSQFKRSLLK